MARSEGGLWLLRVEDLDTPRVVPGIADDMMRTLEILGFRWDGEVLYQSRRTEIYREALELLLRRGDAYPCACSRAEIARIATAPHSGEEGSAYPGTCRNGLPEGRNARSVRVRVGPDPITFHDGVMGDVCGNLHTSGGDFVVKRADGPFAYQLAVVVDDRESEVTQVVRGADLINSTPRQIHLQRLLGYPTPSYFHLPLVTGPGGAKLSKRDAAVSLVAGINPAEEGSSLIMAALRFLGQSPPGSLRRAPCSEIMEWAVDNFSPRSIPAMHGEWPAGE
jgi:glutamyl-Q tRNA(Asp) synthetase